MDKHIVYIQVFLLFAVLTSSCNAQDNNPKSKPMELLNRTPAVAGQFYPGTPSKLLANLQELFEEAEPKQEKDALAIIAPHAGYVYSGKVAASAFNQINAEKKYENIFILASSHRVAFDGASIYNIGHYETPLGEVKVNLELCNTLIEKNQCFTHYLAAHMSEHSLEVQLPFLQHKLGDDIKIVPIVLGTQSAKETKEIADALKPYFNENNLFVISSDFSHYPEGSDAKEIDELTADAIVTKSTAKLIETINANKSKKINNLATSLCGWSSVLTLLHLIEEDNQIEAKKIHYMHSGSVSNDDSRVVGYHAIAFYKSKENNTFQLSKKDKEQLLDIARGTIEDLILDSKESKLNGKDYSQSLNELCGAFVTLHKDDKLRGCIGRFTPNEPLYEVVRQMAIAAATKDYRFSKVKKDEVDLLHIEISVLTPLRKISSIEEVEVGKHGIYIKKGNSSGTLLPQVATENGWGRDEFLEYCSQYKAGIGKDGYKDADIYVYEAIVFEEAK